jgi:hypothetical protein
VNKDIVLKEKRVTDESHGCFGSGSRSDEKKQTTQI